MLISNKEKKIKNGELTSTKHFHGFFNHFKHLALKDRSILHHPLSRTKKSISSFVVEKTLDKVWKQANAMSRHGR